MSAAKRLRRAAKRQGMTSHHDHEPSAWLRDRLTDLQRRYVSGQLRHCGHLAPWQQAVAPLWADVVTCGPCASQNRLSGDLDRTCDRCGIVCRGPIHPCVTLFGPLLVCFGLCPSCQRREVPA